MSPEPAYYEPGRPWSGLWLFASILVVGFLVDLGFGGAGSHLVGWIVVAVLVLGVDALVINATRSAKSLSLTATELRVGDEAIERERIVGITPGVDPDLPALGWETGLRRGMKGVIVHLADDLHVVVPTRHADRLQAALGVGDTDDDALDLTIREADPDDYPAVVEIGERAEAIFHVAGLALPRIETTTDDVAASRAVFVVGRPPVAFATMGEVDGLALVAEIAVLPKHMRCGIGSRLLAYAGVWALDHGYPALVLSTYRDVAWNGPFYLRRGFVEVADPSDGMRAIRAREVALGLDEVGPRVVMRREL